MRRRSESRNEQPGFRTGLCGIRVLPVSLKYFMKKLPKFSACIVLKRNQFPRVYLDGALKKYIWRYNRSKVKFISVEVQILDK